mmetsp:Transcript_28713/g.37667  ORF Transcript_28713/g.37667 Transcript_28713/m.37667 type:complete len:464 (+) Transcript_28713:407-1798(+)
MQLGTEMNFVLVFSVTFAWCSIVLLMCLFLWKKRNEIHFWGINLPVLLLQSAGNALITSTFWMYINHVDIPCFFFNFTAYSWLNLLFLPSILRAYQLLVFTNEVYRQKYPWMMNNWSIFKYILVFSALHYSVMGAWLVASGSDGCYLSWDGIYFLIILKVLLFLMIQVCTILPPVTQIGWETSMEFKLLMYVWFGLAILAVVFTLIKNILGVFGKSKMACYIVLMVNISNFLITTALPFVRSMYKQWCQTPSCLKMMTENQSHHPFLSTLRSSKYSLPKTPKTRKKACTHKVHVAANNQQSALATKSKTFITCTNEEKPSLLQEKSKSSTTIFNGENPTHANLKLELERFSSVDDIFANPEATKKLFEFACLCFMSETVSFLYAVQRFKYTSAWKEQKQVLEEYDGIISKFVRIGGPMEINISETSRESILKTRSLSHSELVKSFDAVYGEMCLLVLDNIFMR